VSAIATKLRDLAEPVGNLTPWGGSGKGVNPRQGEVGKIMESLQRFGQVRPILAQDDGTIVAGNHTYEAAKRLGWEEIAVVRVNLSDAEAQAYLVADNRIPDGATYDDQALIGILQELEENGSLEGTGFTNDDLEDLIAAVEGAQQTEPEPFGGGYAEDPSVTAARWEGRDEGQKREVVFLLPHADFETFKECVTDLKRKYDTDSMATAIYEAIYREARGVSTPPQEREQRAATTDSSLDAELAPTQPQEADEPAVPTTMPPDGQRFMTSSTDNLAPLE
jgi:hypothetical protein